MIQQGLQLAATLDAAGAAKVTGVLLALAGVADVSAGEGTTRVGVAYDQDRTSRQEIATALARAGYPLYEAPAATVCCGACGGGGH